jgi:hypothetical protein
MPMDPIDAPLQRPATLAELAETQSEGSASGQLHAEALLMEEFNHASVVAYQANGDRTALLNLYLVLGGVIATAVGISASAAFATNTVGPLLAIIVGLLLAFVLSFGCFVRLIALGDKYLDALLTMDVIKEVYIQELKGQAALLDRAIRWRLEELLRGGKRRSSGTTFFIGSIIAVIGSFYLGAAAELLYHFTKGFGGAPMVALYLGSFKISGIVVDAPVYVLGLAAHVLYYRRARGQRRIQASIKAAAERFGRPLPS